MVLGHLTLVKTRAQAQTRDVGILYDLETQNGVASDSNIEYDGDVCEFGRENEVRNWL